MPPRSADAAAVAVDEPATTQPYILEEQIGHLLRRAHQRATAIFLDGIGPEPLTPTQWAALVKVGDIGEVSQNRLGRLTAMDPATCQGVIARLHGQGLLERRADPADKRRTLWRLTARGGAVVAAGVAYGRAVTERTLAPLDAGEQAVFLALLKKLI